MRELSALCVIATPLQGPYGRHQVPHARLDPHSRRNGPGKLFRSCVASSRATWDVQIPPINDEITDVSIPPPRRLGARRSSACGTRSRASSCSGWTSRRSAEWPRWPSPPTLRRSCAPLSGSGNLPAEPPIEQALPLRSRGRREYIDRSVGCLCPSRAAAVCRDGQQGDHLRVELEEGAGAGGVHGRQQPAAVRVGARAAPDRGRVCVVRVSARPVASPPLCVRSAPSTWRGREQGRPG